VLLQNELSRAIEIAKKHSVGKLYIVGSTLYGNPKKANDHDFAIDDYSPEIFSISTENSLAQCQRMLT